MLSALDRLAGNDATWRRAGPLGAESFDAVFHTDEYKDYERERYLGVSRAIEDTKDGYRHELSRLHRGLAGPETPTPVDLDAAVCSSDVELVDGFADGSQAGRIVRDPKLLTSTRNPVAGNLMGRCYAASQVLNFNDEDPQRISMTAGVLEKSVKTGRAWNEVLQRLALDVGEHRRGRP